MNNNTSAEQLFIAQNTNSSADLLRELVVLISDKVVLARIASNLNIPPDLLVELTENPALDLILMENPNFIENIFDPLEDWIYCHPETYLQKKALIYYACVLFLCVLFLEEEIQSKDSAMDSCSFAEERYTV